VFVELLQKELFSQRRGFLHVNGKIFGGCENFFLPENEMEKCKEKLNIQILSDK
jgi:hypothetical protein